MRTTFQVRNTPRWPMRHLLETLGARSQLVGKTTPFLPANKIHWVVELIWGSSDKYQGREHVLLYRNRGYKSGRVAVTIARQDIIWTIYSFKEGSKNSKVWKYDLWLYPANPLLTLNMVVFFWFSYSKLTFIWKQTLDNMFETNFQTTK